ncbi:MAG: alkaline phosphatase D family protein [Nitrospira sp.]
MGTNTTKLDQSSIWVVDVANLAPNTQYSIRVEPPLGIPSDTAIICTPPTTLTQAPLELCLFSCYFPSEEYYTNAARAKTILETLQIVPHLKLFAGDQIYGDVPSSSDSVQAIYRDRHRETFQGDRLGSLFAYGANMFTCDDHEFWNSYPDSMWWLSRSYDGNWQESRDEALKHFFQQQGVLNFSPGLSGGESDTRCWSSGKISNLDLFVTDTRSDRTSKDNKRRSPNSGNSTRPSLMSTQQLDTLLAWIDTVDRIGLLVLGQPLWLLSESYDNALCDYPEFDRTLDTLARNMRDRDVTYIVLTGDIHWGRLTVLQNPVRPASKLIEFVSSPIARVGMRSIFSRKLDVGERPNVAFNFDSQPKLNHFFGAYDRRRVFATNENNFGRLSLSSTPSGSVAGHFELWSLDSQSLALDRWGQLDNRCMSTLDLL